MEEDSFFGYDTRLPENRPAARSPHEVPTTASDPFADLNDFPNLNINDLPDDFSNEFNPTGLLPTYDDPWSKTAVSELDKIDARELFPTPAGDQFSTGFFSRNSSSPVIGAGAWDNTHLPSDLFSGKDADEELITDRVSRLIDEESFNGGQIRDDFYASLTKQSFASPTAGESITIAKSIWGSDRQFEIQPNPLWPAPGNGASPADSWGIPNASESRKPAAPPPTPVIHTVLTLEELERRIIPKDPESHSLQNVKDQSQDRLTRNLPLQHQREVQYSQDFGEPDTRSIFQRHSAPLRGGEEHMRYYPVRPGFRMPSDGFPRDQRMPIGMHVQQMHHMHQRPPGFEFLNLNRMRMANGMMPVGPRHIMQNFSRLPPGYRGPRPLPPMYRMPGQHPIMSQVFVNQRYAENPNYDRAEDENVGWMTEREKEWVIKIQQAQVKTENPYMDDFYNHVRCMKKSARQNGITNAAQDFIIPARVASEPKEERPNLFEGSLGKVSISSVFNPRKTVDVEAMNLAKNRALPVTTQKRKWFVDPLQKEKGTPKGLLLSIEELYKLIIELQDFTREIAALPEGQRETEMETRRNIVNMIFGRLLHGTTPETRLRSFCDVIKIRKGRELLRRALPVLFKEQILILIGFCIRAMPILVDASVEKHEEFSRCLEPVADSLRTASLKSLVDLIAPLMESKHGVVDTCYTGPHIVSHVIKSKFAMNFLGLLIARVESCYNAEWKALEEGERDKWTSFINQFLVCLTKTAPAEVASITNDQVRQAVVTHIGRFPFSPESLEDCREKLLIPEATV